MAFWDRWRAGQPAGLILMYHRVADVAGDPALDPWGLCVSPDHFAEQLQVLREYGRSRHFSDFGRAYRDGGTTPTSVVITFDDGYVDNLQQAKPLLDQADMPATVFITTDYIGGTQEFWWDELARMIMTPQRLPATLTLAHDGIEKRWAVATAVSYSDADRAADQGRRPWNALPGTRLAFYYALWQWLRPFPHDVRVALLAQIGRWSEDEGQVRQVQRPLTLAEMRALAADGLVEIGAHTLTHPQLSAHPAAEQHRQMVSSKQRLETWLERPIPTFSYPFGDYDKTTLRLAREIGFTAVCTVEAKPVTTKQPALELPRFTVEDWDGDTFAANLSSWLLSG